MKKTYMIPICEWYAMEHMAVLAQTITGGPGGPGWGGQGTGDGDANMGYFDDDDFKPYTSDRVWDE
ncbi:MAG: hypothetical protein J5637_07700 [Prevotella sp.]|nr:hypothetical protein [Prevotella sp.]